MTIPALTLCMWRRHRRWAPWRLAISAVLRARSGLGSWDHAWGCVATAAGAAC